MQGRAAVLRLFVWDVFFVIYLFLLCLMKFCSDLIDPMEQVGSLQCIVIHFNGLCRSSVIIFKMFSSFAGIFEPIGLGTGPARQL